MPTKLTQREAVFQAVKAALKSEFKEGAKITLQDNQRGLVVEALVKDFQAKKIDFKDTASNQEKLKSPALLKTYVNGLINNWLKRDPRLNGAPKRTENAVKIDANVSKDTKR